MPANKKSKQHHIVSTIGHTFETIITDNPNQEGLGWGVGQFVWCGWFVIDMKAT